jgi:hypothetical protein
VTASRSSASATRGALAFIGLFAAFWSVFTIGFGLVVLRDIVRQTRATGYPTIEGRVLESSVSRTGNRRVAYRAVVEYEYRVDGRIFRGRAGQRLEVSTSGWAREQARSHPKGSTVRVSYDPANPSSSTIEPGVRGIDLLALMFSLPFDFVMAVMWTVVWLAWRDRNGVPIAGGAPITRSGSQVRALMPHSRPWLAAGAAAALSAVVLLVLLTIIGELPSRDTALACWAVVIAVAAYFWWRRRARIASGAEDLVIDRAYATLTLPVEHGRTESQQVPLASIAGVALDEVKRPNGRRTVSSWVPYLTAGEQRLRITTWGNRDQADAFVAWLAAELGTMPFK